MAAQELGGRVHDDVGPVLEGADQVRRRHGVVDDEGDVVLLRDLRERRDVGDDAAGLAIDSQKIAFVRGVIAASKEAGLSVSAQTTDQPKFL